MQWPLFTPRNEQEYRLDRERMVREQLASRGIRDRRVLAAMETVPRHEFIPENRRSAAYADTPVRIGGGQTISQPLMVAEMLQALELDGSERALDVGAGSGYQAALLGHLCREVYAVEIRDDLVTAARTHVARFGTPNVHVVKGDGSLGLPEHAPYDAIVVGAAAPRIPPELVEQLAEGGRLVIPVGPSLEQTLVRVRRRGDSATVDRLTFCQFVPLLRDGGW